MAHKLFPHTYGWEQRKNIISEVFYQKNVFLTIDGNQFRPYSVMMEDELYSFPHECFKGGDDLYSSIAAASILAKVERDNYIEELCNENDELNTKYDIKNYYNPKW